jgi:hypothetical protein
MISPRFSSVDVAGVFGLLAFLSDPKACEARLVELQAEADAAYKARSEAQALVNEAAEAKETIAKAQAEVEQAKKDVTEVVAAAHLIATDADTRLAAVTEREAATNGYERTLEKRDVALTAAELDLATRINGVADIEAAALAVQKEYTDKLEQLRAIAV